MLKMSGFDPKTRSQAPWRLLLGLLCLALVVFTGTMQVAHTHPGGDLSHADCSLCATAHVVAHVVSHPVPAPASVVFAAIQSFTLKLRASRPTVFALFTRPPPAVSIFA